MLPILHYQRYQKFKQALEQLQQTNCGVQLDTPRLRQNFLEAQQFFQQQIVSLDAGDLDPDTQPRVRSYQTEMSKQLRLVGMDVVFLQAARQEETTKARHHSLGERIQTLISYCDAVLQ